MKLKIYANYGVLAHEKQAVYSAVPCSTAVLSEEMEIMIPDGFTASENIMGDWLINTPDGFTLHMGDILASKDGAPAFSWYDGKKFHLIPVLVEVR